jgi:hypothetical protein
MSTVEEEEEEDGGNELTSGHQAKGSQVRDCLDVKALSNTQNCQKKLHCVPVVKKHCCSGTDPVHSTSNAKVSNNNTQQSRPEKRNRSESGISSSSSASSSTSSVSRSRRKKIANNVKTKDEGVQVGVGVGCGSSGDAVVKLSAKSMPDLAQSFIVATLTRFI